MRATKVPRRLQPQRKLDVLVVERSFIESARLDLESSAYAQLADVYLANARLWWQGADRCWDFGTAAAQKKLEDERKPQRNRIRWWLHELEGQLIKWFTADQIGPQEPVIKIEKNDGGLSVVATRIQHRVDQNRGLQASL